MSVDIDVGSLDEITLDIVSDHIFDLYTERYGSSKDLGYNDRSKDEITVTLKKSDIDINVKQSLSQLSSGKESSSTGFVTWESSGRLCDWLLTDERGPFYHLFHDQKGSLDVMELGAGVGGVCVSVLAPLCKRYICTDQKHILKLLKLNIVNNSRNPFKSTSLSMDGTRKGNKHVPIVEVMEYDWEDYENGLWEYEQYCEVNNRPNLIIACDTIYNEYLIPHFINALKVLLTPENGGLVTVHLRDDSVQESFLVECLQRELRVFSVPNELVSEELNDGFAVYYVKL